MDLLPVSPVQKVVAEVAGSLQGSSPKRVVAGFEFVNKLLNKNAMAFSGQPAAKQQIDNAATMAPNYLAQEAAMAAARTAPVASGIVFAAGDRVKHNVFVSHRKLVQA